MILEFLREKIEFKRIILEGEDRSEHDRVTRKWVTVLGRCGKGRQVRERKADLLWEIGPKDLREYRKWFLIFRI
jgi:hypothetical protein